MIKIVIKITAISSDFNDPEILQQKTLIK